MPRTPKLATLLILVLASGAALGDSRRDDDRRYVVVEIAEPYLELRTGPGRGFPVFHVVPRGERVDVLMRRTDYLKVRDDRGREGWARRRDMELTLLPDGTPLDLGDPTRRDYEVDPFEAGAQSGDFGRANVNSVYVGYALNEHLSAEISASQVLGRASNAWFGTVGLFHTILPEKRLAPFVGLGTGVVHIEPKATIVAPEDRTEQIAFAGAGAKFYLSRRFVFRADYRRYVIFTERESNEERDEWKVGFAFFF